ncbi:hypothetical protein GPALN_002135 [Globodera pallida]|nr:hypothetical protein GPALN_002135 [Globodera pallida]
MSIIATALVAVKVCQYSEHLMVTASLISMVVVLTAKTMSHNAKSFVVTTCLAVYVFALLERKMRICPTNCRPTLKLFWGD